MQLGIGTIYGWKVDPDHRYDRRSGEVKTYQLSPEEMAKYQNIKAGTKKDTLAGVPGMKRKDHKKTEDDDMSKIRIDKEELIKLCSNHGIDKQAIKVIADELDSTPKNIDYYIVKWGVENLISKEKPIKETVTETKPEVNENIEEVKVMENLTKAGVIKLAAEGKTVEEIVEHFTPAWNGKLTMLKAKVVLFLSGKSNRPKKNKDSEIVSVVRTESQNTKNEIKPETEILPEENIDTDESDYVIIKPDCSIVYGGAIDIEENYKRPATETEIPKRLGLKPKTMISQDTHLEYNLMDEFLEISDNGIEGIYAKISWKNLNSFIEELQELKRIAG